MPGILAGQGFGFLVGVSRGGLMLQDQHSESLVVGRALLSGVLLPATLPSTPGLSDHFLCCLLPLCSDLKDTQCQAGMSEAPQNQGHP